tara:strand:+ start:4337 stop:4537 length:201 start_codon:yes stop_codon:yes gene_type:complete
MFDCCSDLEYLGEYLNFLFFLSLKRFNFNVLIFDHKFTKNDIIIELNLLKLMTILAPNKWKKKLRN